MTKRILNIIIDRYLGNYRNKRIFLGGMTSLLNKLVNLLIVIVTVPLMFNFLEEERFGMLMVFISFISMMSFADFGLGLSLLNKVAILSLERDNDKLKTSVSTTFFFLAGLSVACLLFMFFVGDKINWTDFLNLKTDIAKTESKSLVAYFALCFFIALPFSIGSKIQIGFQESYINEIWNIVANILSLIIIPILIYLESSTPIIFLGMYGVKCFVQIMQFIALFSLKHKEIMPNIRYVRRLDLKELFSSSVIFSLLQIFAMMVTAFDTMLISNIYGASAVAIFAIVFRLFSIFTTPIQAFASSYLPAINDAYARNDISWLKSTNKKVFKYTLLLSLIEGICFVLLGNFIVSIWISADTTIPLALLISFGFYIIVSNFQDFLNPIMMSPPNLKTLFVIYGLAVLTLTFFKVLLLPNFGVHILVILNIGIITSMHILPSLYYLKKQSIFI